MAFFGTDQLIGPSSRRWKASSTRVRARSRPVSSDCADVGRWFLRNPLYEKVYLLIQPKGFPRQKNEYFLRGQAFQTRTMRLECLHHFSWCARAYDPNLRDPGKRAPGLGKVCRDSPVCAGISRATQTRAHAHQGKNDLSAAGLCSSKSKQDSNTDSSCS
jgi:hypothetical protein